MSGTTLTACSTGLNLAREALFQKGWTQEELAAKTFPDGDAHALVPITARTVRNFLAGKAVSLKVFRAICKSLEIDWEIVAGREPSSQQSPTKGDIEINSAAATISHNEQETTLTANALKVYPVKAEIAQVKDTGSIISCFEGGNEELSSNSRKFQYDAYISFVEQEPDVTWVREGLIPKLEEQGLTVAISGDIEIPGVARVVNIERGIEQSKRIILVLSAAYLKDYMADFENVLGQTLGIEEGNYRLLPIKIALIDDAQLPSRIRMLTILNFTHPKRANREFARLLQALRENLPQRQTT